MAREDSSRQTLERAPDYADEVLAEGRDQIRNLRTATIAFGGLPRALQQVVEEAAPNRSSIFKTVVEGTVLELHPMIREETYRIGREALINALTHRARNLNIADRVETKPFWNPFLHQLDQGGDNPLRLVALDKMEVGIRVCAAHVRHLS